MAGKPVVKGTRLSVEFLLSLFALGWTHAQVLDNYPALDNSALQAVFALNVKQQAIDQFMFNNFERRCFS